MVNRKNGFYKIILFLAVMPLMMANFLFQPVLAAEKLDDQQIEKIKSGLDIVKLFLNLSLDEGSLKTFLNTVIKGGAISTDITYGILVLSSLNEVEMINMVLSQDYKTKGMAYFNQILDERLNLFSYWKGVGLDIPKVLGGKITGPMAALSLNTFSMVNEIIKIFTAVENLHLIKLYDGLWTYFDIRMHHGSHEEAWHDTKYVIGWAANTNPFSPSRSSYAESLNQLSSQFSAIWDTYGPYITPLGLSKDFEQEVKNDLRDTIAESYTSFLVTEQYKKDNSNWNKLVRNMENTLTSLSRGIKTGTQNLVTEINNIFSNISILSSASLKEIPELADKQNELIEELNSAEELIAVSISKSEEIDEETLVKFQGIIQKASEEIERISQNLIFKNTSVGQEDIQQNKEENENVAEEIDNAREQDIKTSCDKNSIPEHKVIFNEIAWMGTEASNNDEWMELKNISGQDIDLTGWQILNDSGQMNIGLESIAIPQGDLLLLERTDDESVSNIPADIIYNGALKNDGEILYVFDNNCVLQDIVSDLPQWKQGDNQSKQTMERKMDLSWQTSNQSGGTPNAENSSGYNPPSFNLGSPIPPIITPIQDTEGSEITICSSMESTPIYSPVILNEIAWMGSGTSSSDEWIELKNISTSAVSLNGWQIIGRNINDNEIKTSIFFDQSDTIEPLSLYILERTNDDSVPNITADKIFSGSINDLSFKLELFNNNCSLIDGVESNPSWMAGQNNPEKRTMERITNLNWQTSLATTSINSLFGTPGEENSQENNDVIPISFSFSPIMPHINEEVTFNASSSQSNVANYSWDFGDETQELLVKSTTTHSFSIPGEHMITLQITHDSGEISIATSSISILTLEVPNLEVVINEIAWAGTKASHSDEWIELYNNSSSTVDLTSWTLRAEDGSPDITFSTSTIINGNDYFLIERTNEETTDAPGDYMGPFGDGLKNIGEKLELRNASGTLIDAIDCSSNWFAGDGTDRISMERINSATGSVPENWQNNNIITRNGKDVQNNRINGTPKSKNSVSLTRTEAAGLRMIQAFEDFNEISLKIHGSPYVFDFTDLNVPQTKTLLIEPGVTLKFAGTNAMINGTLKANGEEDKKIIFTDEREYWRGIQIESAENVVELNHCELYSTLLPVVKIANSSLQFNNSKLENFGDVGLLFETGTGSSTINNSTFKGSSSSTSKAIYIKSGDPIIENSLFENNLNGIYIENNNLAPIIDHNSFLRNKTPINIVNSNPIVKNNNADDNEINGIVMIGTIFNNSSNFTWFHNEMSYVIDRFLTVQEDINLEIEPDVTVEFKNQSYLQIEGAIDIKGTESSPVLFTSSLIESQGRGEWGGLSIESSKKSRINNLIIEHGGLWNENWGNWGQITAFGSEIEINNVSSSYALEAGIHLIDCTSTIENSNLKENKVGIRLSGLKEPTLRNNIYSNNQRYDIYWPNSGEICQNLKAAYPEIYIECGCCYF